MQDSSQEPKATDDSNKGVGVVAFVYVGLLTTLCAIGGWISLKEKFRGKGGPSL